MTIFFFVKYIVYTKCPPLFAPFFLQILIYERDYTIVVPVVNINKFNFIMEKEYLVSKAEEKDAFIVRRIYESLIGNDFYFKEYPMHSYCDCYTEIT